MVDVKEARHLYPGDRPIIGTKAGTVSSVSVSLTEVYVTFKDRDSVVVHPLSELRLEEEQ